MFTLEKFNLDILNHKINVLQDTGVYRHIYCSSGSSNQYFEVVTFPGSLVYTGDMGTYVFSRIDDMFDFFRGRGNSNTNYLSSKIEAGVKTQFNQTLLEKQIQDFVEEALSEENMEGYWEKFCAKYKCNTPLSYYISAIKEEVTEDVLNGELSEYYFPATLSNFQSNYDPNADIFTDWTESINGTETAYRLEWAVEAIKWAIEEYEKTKVVN
jgi:hypothetical protein